MHAIVSLCLLLVASANAISPLFLSDMWEWQTFKLEYNKYYWNEMEESFRFEIFQQNRRYIDEHNQLYAAGEVSYELGLNEYADLLPHELAHFMFGYNGTLQNDEAERITFITPAHVSLPQAVDWRQKGAVTAVKAQGKCGACWAFSTTGALEGQHFRKTGKLVSLSEQNLVDCAGGKYGNSGCGGGFPAKAFKYIKANGGIDTEASYPYTAKNGKCHFNKRTIGASVRGYVSIPKGNEKKLLEATATVGPISIAIDASQKSFQFYKRGVYDDTHCSSTRLDHAVLIVGYGSEGGHDYWLVKNSWSTVWGESGYLKIARNKNRCGLANAACYPLV